MVRMRPKDAEAWYWLAYSYHALEYPDAFIGAEVQLSRLDVGRVRTLEARIRQADIAGVR